MNSQQIAQSSKVSTILEKDFLEGIGLRTAMHQEVEKWRNKWPHLPKKPFSTNHIEENMYG